MKQEDLESLILDRHLGELPGEVPALLDAYLRQVPDSERIVASLVNAAGLAETVITRNPALVQNVADTQKGPGTSELPGKVPLARLIPVLSAACGVVLALFVGFQWGVRTPSRATVEAVSESESERPTASPWARYNVGDLARQRTQAVIFPE